MLALAAVADTQDAAARAPVANFERRTSIPRLADARRGAGLPYDEPALLWTVAHELRAPLSALTVASEVLAEDSDRLSRRQIGRMARTIQSGALWLQTTVENLLCSATIESGTFQLRPEPTVLTDVLLEIERVVEPLLGYKGQRLRLSVRGPLPAVSVDRVRVGQVLINLISNASKFGEATTPVDVTVSHADGWVRIVVADRGPGLPPGLRDRLFAPFYRAGDARRTGAEGVGLGLSIVKSIVAAHRGRVGAANRVRGGARFWVELPVSPATATIERTSAATGATQRNAPGGATP